MVLFYCFCESPFVSSVTTTTFLSSPTTLMPSFRFDVFTTGEEVAALRTGGRHSPKDCVQDGREGRTSGWYLGEAYDFRRQGVRDAAKQVQRVSVTTSRLHFGRKLSCVLFQNVCCSVMCVKGLAELFGMSDCAYMRIEKMLDVCAGVVFRSCL